MKMKPIFSLWRRWWHAGPTSRGRRPDQIIEGKAATVRQRIFSYFEAADSFARWSDISKNKPIQLGKG